MGFSRGAGTFRESEETSRRSPHSSYLPPPRFRPVTAFIRQVARFHRLLRISQPARKVDREMLSSPDLAGPWNEERSPAESPQGREGAMSVNRTALCAAAIVAALAAAAPAVY